MRDDSIDLLCWIHPEISKNPSRGDLSLDLSRWELEHQRLFEDLRRALPDSAKRQTLFDPQGEFGVYMKAMAEDHVFTKNRDLDRLASQCQTPQEALPLAIPFEKDSIVYFTAPSLSRLGKDLHDSRENKLCHVGAISTMGDDKVAPSADLIGAALLLFRFIISQFGAWEEG